MKHLGADYVGIARVEADAIVEGLGVRADGSVLREGHRLALGTGIVGRVVESGEPLLVPDVTRFSGYVPIMDGVRSEVTVPLSLGGKVIGAIDAESRTPDRFGPQDLALLLGVAAPVAQAIRVASLLGEMHKRQRHLQILAMLGREAGAITDLPELMRRTVTVLRQESGYAFAAIGTVDDDGTHTILEAISSELEVLLQAGHRQRVGEGVVGEVVARGASLLVPDVRARVNVVQTHPDLRCELCCPLIVEDRVVGYLDVETREVGGLDAEDQTFLETVAEQLARAVEAAKQRARIERMREDMAAMLVHDLRSPLSVVRTSLSLLQSDLASLPPDALSEEQRQDMAGYVPEAVSSCEEMLVLIDGLLQLHRLESGALTPKLARIDLAALAEQVCSQMEVIGSVRDVAILLDAPSPAECALDAGLLTRVAQNLLVNGIKFSPEHSMLTVRVRLVERDPRLEDGATVRLSVEDRGPGIRPADRERIFDRFSAIEAKGSPGVPSTGLGLAFCRAAVEAHGGRIWVESELGRGSTFCVAIPRKGR
ncbi:MAG: hypothetical protein SangKO_054160 [Sandaracinaceae bacterium]